MKKIALLLLLTFVASSCSTDSDEPEVYYELLPIQRCEMPYRMTSGETYEFKMIFQMPTTCHFYKGIYFEGDGDEKIVAIQSGVYQRNDCQIIDYGTTAQPQNQPVSREYTFTAGAPGTVYHFKMWTGKNEQGEDTYYEVQVPVEN